MYKMLIFWKQKVLILKNLEAKNFYKKWKQNKFNNWINNNSINYLLQLILIINLIVLNL